MIIYLHSDNAESAARYRVTVAPAGDTSFVKGGAEGYPKEWVHADGAPKQIEVNFSFGRAEVDDSLAKYMIARGIVHKSRMLRKVRQLFDRFGNPIDEVFDASGQRLMLDAEAA